MKPVCRTHEAKNEYTTPLPGVPYYRSSGIIYALDRQMDRYAVGRIDFERFDDQNFQYIFSPEWSVIDTLPPAIFQGIPGLDMSLRLEKYYRVNMTPYFIAERTPSENREDLWELLEEVGLDYYDRFEWLLRTGMRCGTDNLIVDRVVCPRRIVFEDGCLLPTNLQPVDCIEIEGLNQLAHTSGQLHSVLTYILRSGAQIWDVSEERFFTREENSILLKMMLIQEALNKNRNTEKRKEGIEKAKRAGKYTGRKKISVDTNLLKKIAEDFSELL